MTHHNPHTHLTTNNNQRQKMSHPPPTQTPTQHSTTHHPRSRTPMHPLIPNTTPLSQSQPEPTPPTSTLDTVRAPPQEAMSANTPIYAHFTSSRPAYFFEDVGSVGTRMRDLGQKGSTGVLEGGGVGLDGWGGWGSGRRDGEDGSRRESGKYATPMGTEMGMGMGMGTNDLEMKRDGESTRGSRGTESHTRSVFSRPVSPEIGMRDGDGYGYGDDDALVDGGVRVAYGMGSAGQTRRQRQRQTEKTPGFLHDASEKSPALASTINNPQSTPMFNYDTFEEIGGGVALGSVTKANATGEYSSRVDMTFGREGKNEQETGGMFPFRPMGGEYPTTYHDPWYQDSKSSKAHATSQAYPQHAFKHSARQIPASTMTEYPSIPRLRPSTPFTSTQLLAPTKPKSRSNPKYNSSKSTTNTPSQNKTKRKSARTTPLPPRTLFLSGFVCVPGDAEYGHAHATTGEREVYWFREEWVWSGEEDWSAQGNKSQHVHHIEDRDLSAIETCLVNQDSNGVEGYGSTAAAVGDRWDTGDGGVRLDDKVDAGMEWCAEDEEMWQRGVLTRRLGRAWGLDEGEIGEMNRRRAEGMGMGKGKGRA
ncbi:hypothetical protein T440DRAFT_474448 [Plenodomus tracheiphilus IPT5]|uniref:Uncharacterized protein n=1 Tax=Plenodomus tracheiphilus IPT5 TaxID=1408161 RepID=A0A6A7BMJ7_9PLEO|nr:hypothetical protein T440DRAFT_474448 [Plenodomus tracheiphilus IPT5]